MDTQGNAVEQADFQPEFYCEHGTFIGNPYGGDYLCSWCESGESWESFVAYCFNRENRAARRNAAISWFRGIDVPSEDFPYKGLVLALIINIARGNLK